MKLENQAGQEQHLGKKRRGTKGVHVKRVSSILKAGPERVRKQSFPRERRKRKWVGGSNVFPGGPGNLGFALCQANSAIEESM